MDEEVTRCDAEKGKKFLESGWPSTRTKPSVVVVMREKKGRGKDHRKGVWMIWKLDARYPFPFFSFALSISSP